MADNRPNRYVEDDKIIYRASTLGTCAKALVALGIGQTPVDFPDWLYERFEQGNTGEKAVLDDLRDCYRIMDQQEGHYLAWDDGQLYVEMKVGEKIVIRGHADGIGTCYKVYQYKYGEDGETTGTKRVIEVKCVTEEYGRDVLRKLPSSWAWQISVYGQFYGLSAVLALGIKGEKGTEDEGKVVNVVTELIDELPYSVKDIKLRVIELERHIENGTYPNCDVKQWPCPFNWLCDDVVDAKGKSRTEDGELAGVLEQSLKIRGTG